MDENMKQETTKHIVELAKRGHHHEKKPTTAKNKVAFEAAKEAGVHTHIVRFLVATSPDTTEETLVKWSEGSNGLTKGQASAICISAHRYALSLLDTTMLNKAGVEALPDLIMERLEAHFNDDLGDDDEDLSEADDDDDDLMDDLSEATTTTTATVTADHISYADLKAVLGDAEAREAMIHAAFLAYKDEPNKRKDNTFNRFYGKSNKSLDLSVAKKPQAFFVRKVANFCGIQLLGIAPSRGKDWATDWLLKGGEETSQPNKEQNRGIRNLIGALYCTIAVKAGVTVFDHDLRRYISEDTVQKLFKSWVSPDADLSHPSAPHNGWLLPYSTGEDGAEKAELMDSAASLLV